MNDTDTDFKIRRNLADAGFTETEIERFLHLCEQRRECEMHRLLSRHRSLLLDAVHENQSRIDCLDFLMYQMNRESNQVKKTHRRGESK